MIASQGGGGGDILAGTAPPCFPRWPLGALPYAHHSPIHWGRLLPKIRHDLPQKFVTRTATNFVTVSHEAPDVVELAGVGRLTHQDPHFVAPQLERDVGIVLLNQRDDLVVFGANSVVERCVACRFQQSPSRVNTPP